MDESGRQGRRLYRARGADGEVAWVDHDELWRLQQEQVERLRRERARRRRSLFAALTALLAVALLLLFLRLRGAPGEPPEAAERTATPAPAVVSPAVTPEAVRAAAERPSRAEKSAQSAALPAAERVAGAVRAWAAAWESRDVEAYLAAYAAGFRPAAGASRSSWEAERRRRLAAPEWIRLEIEDLEVATRGDRRAEARFLQSYESPEFADVVRKTLELVEEEGGWRIVGESAETISRTR